MTSSAVLRHLDSVWDEIQSTVDKAIDEKNDPTALDKLFDVERVADDEFRPGDDEPDSESELAEGHTAARWSNPTCISLRHVLPLKGSHLYLPPIDEIRTWASEARRIARDLVLANVMWVAGPVVNREETLKRVVPLPNEFHHLKLLAFQELDDEEKCTPIDKEFVRITEKGSDRYFVDRIVVDRPTYGHPPPSVCGLLFERCGGPVVYRCSELTLSKPKEADHSEIELVLEEKFRLGVGLKRARTIRSVVADVPRVIP